MRLVWGTGEVGELIYDILPCEGSDPGDNTQLDLPDPLEDISPEFKKIINETQARLISEERWREMDKVFKQAYDTSPLFRSMYVAFVLNEVQFTWQVASYEDYDGAYLSDSEEIHLDISLFSESKRLGAAIGEELFHAYQVLYNKPLYQAPFESGDGLGVPNLEFEAKLFLDILQNNCDPPAFATFDIAFDGEFNPDYVAWLGVITNDGTQLPQSYSVMESEYFSFVESFRDTFAGSNYDAPINYSFGPDALINLIQVCGCTH